MRFFSIIIISFFGLSIALAYHLPSSVSEPGKRLKIALANLRDGYDAVYKITKYTIFIDKKYQMGEKESVDLYLRKSSENDPNKVVVHLKNVNTTDDNEQDRAALALPMVIKYKDFMSLLETLRGERNKLNFFPFRVYLTKADTIHSMVGKVSSWKDLENAFDDSDTVMKMMENSNFTGKFAFGTCNVSIEETKSDGKVTVEVNTTRKQCTGEFLYNLMFKLFRVDTEDVVEESSMSIKFQYDEASGQVMEFTTKVEAILANEQKNVFLTGLTVHFDGFKEIQGEFDETKMTKKFTDAEYLWGAIGSLHKYIVELCLRHKQWCNDK